MTPDDIAAAFKSNRAGLDLGRDLMLDPPPLAPLPSLDGAPVGPDQALRDLAGVVITGSTRLDDPGFFAHMDPVTPWITWVAAQWAARLNQNLLHDDTGRVARELEARVVAVLAPRWGMDGGHMVPGSTLANLTALWAAREQRRVTTVVASEAAHISVPKAALLLGLDYRPVPTDGGDRLDPAQLGDLTDAAVVLTAGTTATGAIDNLDHSEVLAAASWVHVDAAWAGPLRLSPRWGPLLEGVEQADSVAISAHKWLHQPKESALALFRDTAAAHDALSFGADYLAVPNIGILGSHGYSALPLAATLLAYGVEGLGAWVDHAMDLTTRLTDRIAAHSELEQWGSGPGSGVVAWRHRHSDSRLLQSRLQDAFVSVTIIGGEPWLRSVAANPLADPDQVVAAVLAAGA